MKYGIIIVTLLLSACSSNNQSLSNYIAKQTLENLSDSEISYNTAHCAQIKNQCPADKYEQWQQSNGATACSCKE